MEIEESVKLIGNEAVPVTDTVTAPLCDVSGLVLANDITAKDPVPAFARSAMDGYAVKACEVTDASKELPVRLNVIGEILAGDSDRGRLSHIPSSAVRVMTGGMIPDGYDAVVRQEDTDLGEDAVEIYAPVSSHMNYCPVGEEIQRGETVLCAGRRIGRVEIGILAALGINEVTVRRPARVAVISTGSELVSPGEELQQGKIYGSIRYMLETSVKQESLDIIYSVDCADDEDLISEHIVKAAKRADVIITTGGVSVGKRDLLPAVLRDLGARILFSGVSIQPGTPTMASVYQDKIILSLSGNPYAALANFDLYFPVIVSGLMGSDSYLPRIREAVLKEPYDKVNRMRRLVRAFVERGEVYLPADSHKSSVFGNMDRCNCYMDIPAGTKLSVGDKVRIREIRYR